MKYQSDSEFTQYPSTRLNIGVCGRLFGFALSISAALVQVIPLDGTKGAYRVAGVIQTTGGTIYLTMTDRGTDSQGNAAYGTVATITGLPR